MIMSKTDEKPCPARRAAWRRPIVRRMRAGEAENNAGSGTDFNGRLS